MDSIRHAEGDEARGGIVAMGSGAHAAAAPAEVVCSDSGLPVGPRSFRVIGTCRETRS